MYAKHTTQNYHIEADSGFIQSLQGFEEVQIDGLLLKKYATDVYEFSTSLNGYVLLQPYNDHLNNTLPTIPVNTQLSPNECFYDSTTEQWRLFNVG